MSVISYRLIIINVNKVHKNAYIIFVYISEY
jgi:hypothetical protein